LYVKEKISVPAHEMAYIDNNFISKTVKMTPKQIINELKKIILYTYKPYLPSNFYKTYDMLNERVINMIDSM